MRFVPIAVTIGVLVSCSPSSSFCGESFCLTESSSAISKERPAVDFNLYRTTLGEKHFLIYEGNDPNTTGDHAFGLIRPDAVPKGFVEGRLFGSERGYQVVLRTINRTWPQHVAVSAVVKNPNELAQLVSKLEGKRSREG